MKRAIIGLVCASLLVAPSLAFSDIDESHWAYNAVNSMYEKGIISGFSDGTFKPQAEVTREQFASILVNALKIKGTENNMKIEDAENRWSTDYIYAVSEYLEDEVVSGKNYFYPDKPAVREDVCVAIVKAKGLENEEVNYSMLDKFSDKNSISSEAKEYVAIAVEKGVMSGNSNGTFNPKGNLTRAEVTAIMANVVETEHFEKKKEFINKLENMEYATYGEYDELLNEIYAYLRDNMAKDEFSKLKENEMRWIKLKENAISKSSDVLLATKYTKERCYYLISLLDNMKYDGTSRLISGEMFNEKITCSDKVVFDDYNTNNYGFEWGKGEDVSANEDNSIQLFKKDGVSYILSKETIFFNTDSSYMFANDGGYLIASITFNNVNMSNVICNYRMFLGCGELEMPNSVTSIRDSAFRGCSRLTSIEIPNSVTSIGEDAFRDCSGLTSIEIPNSVTNIGEDAFLGCSGLTSITVDLGNNKYKSDGNCIIEKETGELVLGCSQTKIPSSVTSIGSGAFRECGGLTSIEMPNSVASIGECAFYDCSGLTSIEIPNSVTSIGEYAFYDCNGLTSIEIPDSVTSIGECSFGGCSGLTSIAVSLGNNKYKSDGNCIIEKETGELVLGCGQAKIPSSVISIGSYAFNGCSGLTSIKIPNSVTSIGAWAFGGCSSLTSIEIPSSVTSIWDHAFEGCNSLTDIIIASDNPTYKFENGKLIYKNTQEIIFEI